MFSTEKVFLGIAPIGWCNDDMPELGRENTFEQTISEMALAGFTGCEIGNKYPSDPAVLKEALDLRGLKIASRWFSSFIITKPMTENIASFKKELDFLEAVGANRINVSEQSYSIQGQMETPVLENRKYVMNDTEWETFAAGLDELGKIAKDRGFRLCFHHHMGTVVQTLEETERLIGATTPGYVYLCYDTGHFAFAGEDPVTILKKHAGRVGHVHLKDIRPGIVKKVKNETMSFLEAVKEGAFTVPGDGCIDFDTVFSLLADSGYAGWLLVEAEQDPSKANPLKYAMMARNYIKKHAGL